MEWSDRYRIGIEEIDRQHMQLFDLVHDLQQALETQANSAQILMILQELMRFSTQHFDSEESLMRETEYPAYLPHADQHLEFKERILTACRQAIQEDPKELLDELLSYLTRWLSGHLLQTDMAYVEHFRAHGVGSIR